MIVKIVSRQDKTLTAEIERQIYQLRYATFAQRLGWQVETCGALEFDDFDALDGRYVVALENGAVIGCWRMLPTVGPNMLRDVFPQLLAGAMAPCGPDVWELSRFAVVGQQGGSFGFSSVPVKMMYEAVRYANLHGVGHFVTVTTLAIERLLKQLGLQPLRLGPPLVIGTARTVALRIEIGFATQSALLTALHMEARKSAMFEPRTSYALQLGRQTRHGVSAHM